MLSLNNYSIKKIVESGTKELKSHKIENPGLESEILLGSLLSMTRTQIILHDDKVISESDVRRFEELLKRKISGEPTAYILGYKEFYGREFRVNSSVLIPRPETEELVEWIIQSHKALDSVLDLCTGSGCIGITVALEIHTNRLFLSDKSENALLITKENAKLLPESQNVSFFQSDLFTHLNLTDLDLIVSNPPYVIPDEYVQLEPGVKNFEPMEALLLENPEKFNEELIQGARETLRTGGMLYLETNPVLVKSLKLILENSGFNNVIIKRDLSGKDRFIRACKN